MAAPKKTLNLADVTANNNRKKSPTRAATKFRETRRQRKKREWLARKSEHRANNNDGATERNAATVVSEEQSYWAYLPDLVLEIIFQMLPYKVTLCNQSANMLEIPLSSFNWCTNDLVLYSSVFNINFRKS